MAESGPDISVPGARHASAVRRAARSAAVPPPGTPVTGAPPVGKVYPAAAVGTERTISTRDVARGQTLKWGKDAYVVTDVVNLGGGRHEVWGYRPGVDDPNVVTQDATTKQWRQGTDTPRSRT